MPDRTLAEIDALIKAQARHLDQHLAEFNAYISYHQTPEEYLRDRLHIEWCYHHVCQDLEIEPIEDLDVQWYVHA